MKDENHKIKQGYLLSVLTSDKKRKMREKERDEREGGVSFYGRKEFSVFISNLPDKLDKYGLKGIFIKAGKVSDVYIPKGKSVRSRRRYCFGRFWN